MSQMPNPARNNARRNGGINHDARRSGRRRAGALLLMGVFLGIIALIVLVSPKTHLGRAVYTMGTDSGRVDTSNGTESAYYKGLVISELMPSNQTSVPDEKGEYHDWVELWNNSGHDIDLYGVGLSNKNTSIRFMFMHHTIIANDQRIVVFCSNSNQADPGKPYHAKFKLSSSGATVYLYEPSAYLIDSVSYRVMGTDTSLALMEDGSFAETTAFSPGYPNTEQGHLDYMVASSVSLGAVIINEIAPDVKSGLADEDGEFVDWIELYNTTDKTISLDAYALSDKENKPLKWRFPEGAVIPPRSYYIVFCSGKDRRSDASGIPHTNFRLSAEHDTVVLSDSHGRLVDRVVIDNIPEDCSYARRGDGFVILNLATPTLPNTQEGAWVMDHYMRQLNPSGVYISEVMASNQNTAIPGVTDTCDWIELYNSSGREVDLSGYGLSDNIGRPRRWQFPSGTVMQPGTYMVVLCDGKSNQMSGSLLHTNFKIKRAGGETVCLSDANGKVLDKLVLPEVPTNVSYGRTYSMTGFFYYKAGTPGEDNVSESFRGYA